MKSEILKGEHYYAVYLPPDQESSERNYSVLFELQGAGDAQIGRI